MLIFLSVIFFLQLQIICVICLPPTATWWRKKGKRGLGFVTSLSLSLPLDHEMSFSIMIPTGWCDKYFVIMQWIPRDDRNPIDFTSMRHFYNNPCYALFYKSRQLLNLVLSTMRAMVTNSGVNSSTMDAVVSVLLLMHKEAKIQPIISSLDAWTGMLEKLCSLLVWLIFGLQA